TILSDSVPANTTYKRVTPGAGVTCPTQPTVDGGGTLTCTVTGSLAVGASATVAMTVRVLRVAPVGSTITNTATASSGLPDTIAANNSATATATVAALSADLAVAKTASTVSSPSTGAAVVAGREITYTITATNNGPSDTTGTITISDTTPPNTTFARTSGAGWSCSGVAPGATGTVSCVYTAPDSNRLPA